MSGFNCSSTATRLRPMPKLEALIQAEIAGPAYIF